jgi:hypothetical protein
MPERPVSRRALLASAGLAAAARVPPGTTPARGVARTRDFLAPRVLVLNYDPVI